eukprot:SAG11_NODE_15413_length_579_cov_0.952083_1_plen_21_part_10
MAEFERQRAGSLCRGGVLSDY